MEGGMAMTRIDSAAIAANRKSLFSPRIKAIHKGLRKTEEFAPEFSKTLKKPPLTNLPPKNLPATPPPGLSLNPKVGAPLPEETLPKNEGVFKTPEKKHITLQEMVKLRENLASGAELFNQKEQKVLNEILNKHG